MEIVFRLTLKLLIFLLWRSINGKQSLNKLKRKNRRFSKHLDCSSSHQSSTVIANIKTVLFEFVSQLLGTLVFDCSGSSPSTVGVKDKV